MYIAACFYNLCDFHHSLRLWLSAGRFSYKLVQRTRAMAAALTDHQWTADELLRYLVPPPRWTPPKRRGRPSKDLLSRVLCIFMWFYTLRE
jgi:hypothetical protein